jgi:hypothetical protein
MYVLGSLAVSSQGSACPRHPAVSSQGSACPRHPRTVAIPRNSVHNKKHSNANFSNNNSVGHRIKENNPF